MRSVNGYREVPVPNFVSDNRKSKYVLLYFSKFYKYSCLLKPQIFRPPCRLRTPVFEEVNFCVHTRQKFNIIVKQKILLSVN